MSQPVFSICQNPEGVGSNANKKNGLTSKSESKQAKKASFHLPCPVYGLPAEGVAEFRDLLTLNDLY